MRSHAVITASVAAVLALLSVSVPARCRTASRPQSSVSAPELPATSAETVSEVLEGPWSGKISVGQTELTLVFNFAVSDDGSISVTLDSPDQGAEGIEAECDAASFLRFSPHIAAYSTAEISSGPSPRVDSPCR